MPLGGCQQMREGVGPVVRHHGGGLRVLPESREGHAATAIAGHGDDPLAHHVVGPRAPWVEVRHVAIQQPLPQQEQRLHADAPLRQLLHLLAVEHLRPFLGSFQKQTISNGIVF